MKPCSRRPKRRSRAIGGKTDTPRRKAPRERSATKPPPEPTAAERFFRGALRHVKGRQWSGKRFELLPWQLEEVIRPVFGKEPRTIRTVYIEIPRKNGKALALDTPIPTPTGWVTMGDITTGQTIFDERGHQRRVVAVGPVLHSRPCYRVSFSNGEEVTADAEHEWLTSARVDRPGRTSRRGIRHGQSRITRIRTTLEIHDTQTCGRRADSNHSISMPQPLEIDEAALPVDPYVLGAWLGDGTSSATTITVHRDEAGHFAQQIERAGYLVADRGSGLASLLQITSMRVDLFGGRRPVAKSDPENLRKRLRDLGILGRKRIPSQYLRAGRDQRLALLQGLMDTDGTADRHGRSQTFCSIRKALAEDVCELLSSLGVKHSMRRRFPRCNGRRIDRYAYEIQFNAFLDETPAFRLKRKLERQRVLADAPRSPRSRSVQITSVEPTGSVPVRCIQTSAPSGLFLFGRSMLPTHNSTLGAGIALELLYVDREPGAEIYSAAGDRDQARIIFDMGKAMVEGNPKLRSRSRIYKNAIEIPAMHSVWKVLSAEAYSKHGLNAHGIIFDELHVQPNRELWDVLTTSTGARVQPLTVAITTAGYDRESICWEVHEYASRILRGEVEDPTFLPVIYAADPEKDDWTDPKTWRKANPSIGSTISEEYLAKECAYAQQVPGAQNRFKRLHLNIWTQQDSLWLPMDLWRDCDGVVDLEALRGKPCFGGLDLSSTTDTTAYILAFPGPPVRVLCHFWLPKHELRERILRDQLPYDVWARDGHLTLTEGNVVDQETIKRTILESADLYDLKELAFDRWNATKLVTELQDEGIEMVAFGQGFASMSAPAKELERLVLSLELAYGNHPVLTAQAASVSVRQDPAGNIKPDKVKSTKRIDGIVALCMALGRLMAHSGDDGGSIYDEYDPIVA